MTRVTNHIDIELGRRLREARLAREMTQASLAGFLGVSFQQIHKYENGSNRISAVNSYKLAKSLDLPITYFFDGLDDSHLSPAGKNVSPDVRNDAIRVAHVLNDMRDGTVKDNIFDLIKAFSKAA